MSRQTFPLFVDQPGLTLHNFRITGATVTGTDSTTGLDGRGANLCTISKAAAVVTINWNVPFAEVPYVFIQLAAGQADTTVVQTTSTVAQLVITTGVGDADLDVLVCGYNTTSYVS
jgi:hypothetical protein